MGRYDDAMIELTKTQKLIKERYFKIVDHDPLQFAPISDESFKLAPHTLIKVIDMIVNILREEYDGDINWVKTT
ncbi:hypothetical protein LCGC14_1455640 [marine sediment metagenome]|uniref:Uncharacterized protein n=1 Tax=marine sediment metagenome TaxID=412755 RepID=A0A0F9LX76_9ZZZZ